MNTTCTVRTFVLCATALVLAILLPTTTNAQQETAIWHFGQGIALDFNIPPATPAGPVQANSAIAASEGSAAICDRATGQTLFYTNGIFVWDRNNATMPGASAGTPLGGGASSTQAALVVQDLSNANRYYVFTTAAEGQGSAEYSVVDMTLRGGLGDVDPAVRRVALPTLAGTPPPARVCEKLAATRDAAGTGYWIVIHEWTLAAAGSNRFFAYHLSSAGIDGLLVSNAGTAILPVTANARGELKFSPDGVSMAAVSEAQVTEVFRFNNTSGAITFASTLASGRQGYGASFSPNSRLLYINNGWNGTPGRVSQYDVLAGTALDIATSEVVVGATVQGSLGGMQISPDGRIYITKYTGSALAAIPCPDVRGTGCGFVDNFFTFNPAGGKSLSWGLPNLILESVATPLYAGNDDTLCAGDRITLGTTPRQGFTYAWQPAAGLSDPTSAQPSTTPAGNARYIVRVTSPAACTSFDTVDVVVNALPTRATSPDTAICLGTSAPLRALGGAPGATYAWTPATDLVGANTATPVATPNGTTTYSVTITNPTGCIDSAQITVTVNAVPTAVVSADATICNGTSTQLVASGGTTYRWLPITGLSDPTLPNPVAAPRTTTAYQVIVTNASGCSDTGDVTVTVNPNVTATVSNDTTICSGNIAPLVATGGSIYAWTPATGLSDPSLANPVAMPFATTTYQVIVTNGSGCSDTAFVTVNVNPTPVATVSADTAICAGNSALLVASGGTIYRWEPTTALSDPTSPTPTATPLTTTTYSVIVENSSGCRDTAQVTVSVSTAAISIALPDTIGDPHDRDYRIPVRLVARNIPGECSPSLVGVTITFDENLFFPTSVTRGQITSNTVVNGMRVVRIEFGGANVLDSIITQLVGSVLLGDTVATSLTIDSVQWAGALVTTTLTNGRLRLSPICEEGGPRLLAARQLTILRVAPNPTHDFAIVEVGSSRAGQVHLDVYSTSDARMFTTTWSSDGTGAVPDVRRIQLPADLPSGAYRVVLRGSGEVTTTMLLVTK